MSAQAYADRLATALTRTGMVEPVNATFSHNRVGILMRVKAGVEQTWNTLITNMLLSTEFFSNQAHRWDIHICRMYFLREKKLVFGWSINVTSLDMSHSLDELIRVVNGGNPEPARTEEEREETMEFPLIGAPPERNVPGSGGKGAHTIGGKGDFRPPARR